MSSVRPNAHADRTPLPTPGPIRPRHPRKSRHFPAPPVPRPCPIRTPRTANHVPTPASFLPTNPPRSGKFATGLETPVHPCYPRLGRGGLQTRPRDRRGPETLPPTGKHRWGIPCGRSASLVGALWQRRETAGLCPLLPRGATLMPRIAHAGITELSRTGGTPSYERNRMKQNATDFAFPHSWEQRCWGHLVT